MRLRTLLAGREGYLFADLLTALVILSLAGTVLLGGLRNLCRIQDEAHGQYESAKDAYEAELFEQVR